MLISLSGCATPAEKRLAAAKSEQTKAEVADRALAEATALLDQKLPQMPPVCKERVLVSMQRNEPLDLLVLRYDDALGKSNDVNTFCYQWYQRVRAAFNPEAS